MSIKQPTPVDTVDSLATADQALHELGWLLHEQERLDALCKQAIEKLKEDFAGKAVVTIGTESVSLGTRIDAVRKLLMDWTAANIREHLDKGKRKRVLSHGELGFRQQPRVVEIGIDEETGEPYKPELVLQWIREGDLSKAQRVACTETTTKLHLRGAKEAYEAGKLSIESLASVGLVVRDACDAPVVTPAKIHVTAE